MAGRGVTATALFACLPCIFTTTLTHRALKSTQILQMSFSSSTKPPPGAQNSLICSPLQTGPCCSVPREERRSALPACGREARSRQRRGAELELGSRFVYRHGPSVPGGCWKQRSTPGSSPLPASLPAPPPLLSAPKKDHSLLHNGTRAAWMRSCTHGLPFYLTIPFSVI